MIAPVQPPDGDDLEHHAGEKRGDNGQNQGGDEASGHDREGGGEIGAEHVQRTMRQVDEVHDAENQRQPGRQQKQQHAELHTVEALLDEIQHGLGSYSTAPSPSKGAGAYYRMTAFRHLPDGKNYCPSFIGHWSWNLS